MDGNRIMKLRLLKGLNQRQLSQILGISNTLVNVIESGKNTNPKLDTIIKYCEFFNITVFDFIGAEKSKNMFLKMIKEWEEEGIIDGSTSAKIYAHTFVSNH